MLITKSTKILRYIILWDLPLSEFTHVRNCFFTYANSDNRQSNIHHVYEGVDCHITDVFVVEKCLGPMIKWNLIVCLVSIRIFGTTECVIVWNQVQTISNSTT